MATEDPFPDRGARPRVRHLPWVIAPGLGFLLACVLLTVALAQGQLRREALQRVEAVETALAAIARDHAQAVAAAETAPAGTPIEVRHAAGGEPSLRVMLPLRHGARIIVPVTAETLLAGSPAGVVTPDVRLWLLADAAPAGAPASAGASRRTEHPAPDGLLLDARAYSSVHQFGVGAGFDAEGLWWRYGPMLPIALAGSLIAGLLGLSAGLRREIGADTPAGRIARALGDGEFEGHLQPIVELATGRCIGAEMLIRWRHPQLGLLPPAAFLAQARDTGLIGRMTEACFRQVAERLDACLALPEGFMLSVNFSARQLASERDCAAFIALARPGGRRWYSVIEVAEGDAHDPAMTARMVQMQGAGFLIALDDFGSAHGGARWLERLPVDLIKIDRPIVATIGTDSVTRSVLDAIVELSRSTGVHLIAEGVETRSQASHLRALGVGAGQGHHFSEAVPVAEFVERWLQPETDAGDEDDPITRLFAATRTLIARA
jgi:EAL domain-containing protein (putative c-di-GMP-specific phosphodiesterase class I)